MASSRGVGFPLGEQSASASQRGGQIPDVESGSQGRRNDDSWVEVSSQPSSSSLSSIGDDAIAAGIRHGGHSAYVQRRRRLLQLSQQQHQRQSASSPVLVHAPRRQRGTSSQDEYDETESEEDRVMTSSTENVQQTAADDAQPEGLIGAARPAARLARDGSEEDEEEEEDDDDDENATALGNPSSAPTFRPQPNVFSHPPQHLTHRHSAGGPVPSQHPHLGRPALSARSQSRTQRTRSNYMSPSYQADNDAALRASLTTLLSCAAAARGLPKKEGREAGEPTLGTGVRPSTAPMDFRVVNEAELMAPSPPASSRPAAIAPIHAGPLSGKTVAPSGQHRRPARTASNSSGPSAPSSTSSGEAAAAAAVAAAGAGLVGGGGAGEKTKRTAPSQAPQQSKQRAAKKKRTGASSPAAAVEGAEPEPAAAFLLSPTLLTWVVSAGVLVLVSVVGFGAGYVIGREVGRQEGGGAAALSGAAQAGRNVSGGCGGEMVRSSGGGGGGGGAGGAGGGGGGGGLRTFRWSGAARGVTA